MALGPSREDFLSGGKFPVLSALPSLSRCDKQVSRESTAIRCTKTRIARLPALAPHKVILRGSSQLRRNDS